MAGIASVKSDLYRFIQIEFRLNTRYPDQILIRWATNMRHDYGEVNQKCYIIAPAQILSAWKPGLPIRLALAPLHPLFLHLRRFDRMNEKSVRKATLTALNRICSDRIIIKKCFYEVVWQSDWRRSGGIWAGAEKMQGVDARHLKKRAYWQQKNHFWHSCHEEPVSASQ